MAVENTYDPLRQSGDGVTTRFFFNFTVYRDEDLVVELINKTTEVSTEKDLAEDYTVTIYPTSEGGYIDFIGGVVPASTEWVFIYSEIAETQPTSFPLGEGIREESVERMADRIMRVIQQVSAKVVRAIRLPLSVTAEDIYFPTPEADKIVGWNAAGDGLENKTPMDADAQAAAEAAAAIAVAAAEDAVEAKEAAELIADLEVASQAEAEGMVNNTAVLTPLRGKQLVDQYVIDEGLATTDDVVDIGTAVDLGSGNVAATQATTSGFLKCIISCANNAGLNVIGYTDGNANPVTEMAKAGVARAESIFSYSSYIAQSEFLMPVKAGNYYSTASAGTGTIKSYWIPNA